jgi:HSP20 family protein
VAQFSLIPADESRDLADDIRELFDDLAANLQHEQRAYSGECRPPLDVLESAVDIEIVMDLSGVAPEALRVLYRAGVVIIAGEKAPVPVGSDQSYHLVEREFGRFARVVRLAGAFDVGNARASMRNGELTIVLPKLEERRGQAHRIAVSSGDPEPGTTGSREPGRHRPA